MAYFSVALIFLHFFSYLVYGLDVHSKKSLRAVSSICKFLLPGCYCPTGKRQKLYFLFGNFPKDQSILILILQYIIDSPESPISSTFGFLVVISVTAVKQGYEDWIRHRADDLINNRKVDVVKDGKILVHGQNYGVMFRVQIFFSFNKIFILQTTRSKHLKVGDIIRLEDEDPLPADILVLSSSDDFHRCQITTANLDGESNLKVAVEILCIISTIASTVVYIILLQMRYCPPGLPKLQSSSDFLNLHAILECEQPSANLYSFNGNLLMFKKYMQSQPESLRSRSSRCQDQVSLPGSMSRRLGMAVKILKIS